MSILYNSKNIIIFNIKEYICITYYIMYIFSFNNEEYIHFKVMDIFVCSTSEAYPETIKRYIEN